MEGLLNIKGAAFAPGAHFLLKMPPFRLHFGAQSGIRMYKKRTKKLNAKFYRKGAQKDTKTTPKWLPKSTPRAPKWCPNV